MSLSATVSIDQAAAQTWDAIIVGAGPAGSSAAIRLSRLGASVLLVDQSEFPRAKVCGCCLNARSIASLAALGLADLAERFGAVQQGAVILAFGKKRAQLPLPSTLSLSRETLDAELIGRAIDCGAHFLPKTRASLAAPTFGLRIVQFQTADAEVAAKARIVLAADGLAGGFAAEALGGVQKSPASRIGLGTIANQALVDSPEHAILMACAPGGYVGLAQVEGHQVAIGAAVDPQYLHDCGTPAAAVSRILESAHLPPIAGIETLRWRGTPSLTRRPRYVATHRLFALGDAAGYVEPFTGEGMAWSFAAGEAIAPLALRGIRDWIPSLADEWVELHHRIVRRRQATCRALAYTLRRPKLASMAITIAGLIPGLTQPIIEHLNQTDRNLVHGISSR